MTDQGYHKTQADHCVFVKKLDGGDVLILLMYVDDMLIVGWDHLKIEMLKKALSMFSMKDMVRQERSWRCTLSGTGQRGYYGCHRRST